jgi:hypothetical protein
MEHLILHLDHEYVVLQIAKTCLQGSESWHLK